MNSINFSLVCLICIFSALFQGTSSLDPYSLEHSKKLAVFASVAACPQECITSWSCKRGLSQPLSEVSFF